MLCRQLELSPAYAARSNAGIQTARNVRCDKVSQAYSDVRATIRHCQIVWPLALASLLALLHQGEADGGGIARTTDDLSVQSQVTTRVWWDDRRRAPDRSQPTSVSWIRCSKDSHGDAQCELIIKTRDDDVPEVTATDNQ